MVVTEHFAKLISKYKGSERGGRGGGGFGRVH